MDEVMRCIKLMHLKTALKIHGDEKLNLKSLNALKCEIENEIDRLNAKQIVVNEE